MDTCIEITNLRKCYGSTVAVRSLSMEVRQGELFGLLGPNGAGKTTTLHMLAGLVLPTSGHVKVFGRDLASQHLSIKSRMGVLVDRPSFYNYLSARRNLELLARIGRRAEAGCQADVAEALRVVGLSDMAKRKVGAFSSGMRQRLGLAQALLGDPQLLILDEPANGLDVEATRDMLSLLRRLAHEKGATIVLSSHLLHEVEVLCDRVAIIDRGELLACERTDALASYDLCQVEVLVDAPEAAAGQLAQQAWVAHTAWEPGKVCIELAGATVHQLTMFLIAAGYTISGVIPKRRTLQEFFLEVLKR